MQASLASKILNKIYEERRHTSPSGMGCTYMAFSKKWGIKIWYNENERDFAYAKQNEAAKHGFAPKVGEAFELVISGSKKYCYTTQVANSIYRTLVTPTSERYQKSEISYSELRKVTNDVEYEYVPKIKTLNKAIHTTLGWSNSDDHLNNYGLLDGNVVLIDFGSEGIYESEGEPVSEYSESAA